MENFWSGAITGVVIAVISSIIIEFVKAKVKKRKEYTLILNEIKDLGRHFSKNVNILNQMDLSKGIPMNMHFEKLKVFEQSLIFSQDTYRTSDKKIQKHIYRFKLELRNIHIEIDDLLAYLKSGNVNEEVVEQFVGYIKMKNEYILKRIEYLKKNGFIYPDKGSESQNRKVHLLYKQQPVFMNSIN